MNDEVTKSEVRGRRNIRSKTVKRHPTHVFDDEKEVKGGRRGHSRFANSEYEVEIDEDDPYADHLQDWKRFLK